MEWENCHAVPCSFRLALPRLLAVRRSPGTCRRSEDDLQRGQGDRARRLLINGPDEFKKAGEGPAGRKDIKESTLKVPNVVFDDRLVLDDGKQRVEFLFFGHAHTAGDGCAWLPKHKILCTGDACVNGAFNFMGHSDSASWVRALEKMQQLDVKMVAPGHGPVATKELLEKQKRYFVELRQTVKE